MNFFPFSLCLCPSVFVRCLFVFSVRPSRPSRPSVLLSFCPRGGPFVSLSPSVLLSVCVLCVSLSLFRLSVRPPLLLLLRRAVHRRAEGFVRQRCMRPSTLLRAPCTDRERERERARQRERKRGREKDREKQRKSNVYLSVSLPLAACTDKKFEEMKWQLVLGAFAGFFLTSLLVCTLN